MGFLQWSLSKDLPHFIKGWVKVKGVYYGVKHSPPSICWPRRYSCAVITLPPSGWSLVIHSEPSAVATCTPLAEVLSTVPGLQISCGVFCVSRCDHMMVSVFFDMPSWSVMNEKAPGFGFIPRMKSCIFSAG